MDMQLPGHVGQHCPGGGGSGLGHGRGAHSTTWQSMVGRTVGSGGFVGVGRGSASVRVACVIITSRDLPYGHYLVKTFNQASRALQVKYFFYKAWHAIAIFSQ